MLKIDNEYWIDADAYQYTQRKRVKNNHDEKTLKRLENLGATPAEFKESVVGYYSCLEDALEGYSRDLVRNKVMTKEMTLDEVRSVLEGVRATIAACQV